MTALSRYSDGEVSQDGFGESRRAVSSDREHSASEYIPLTPHPIFIVLAPGSCPDTLVEPANTLCRIRIRLPEPEDTLVHV